MESSRPSVMVFLSSNAQDFIEDEKIDGRHRISGNS